MKFCRALSSVLLMSFVSPVLAEELVSDLPQLGVPPHKMTELGLYMSSSKAFELLTDDPRILFIDVRDPVEAALMGHPREIDKIVPFHVQSDEFNEEISEYSLVPNENFLKEMEQTMIDFGKSKHDLIIVTCGSGYRSAKAVREMISAGYTNVWHIPDGYDGEEKPGMNLQNAWYNNGLPWSYKLAEETPWIKAIVKKTPLEKAGADP